MGFSKVFKKEKVPSELPELALDEISSNTEEKVENFEEEKESNKEVKSSRKTKEIARKSLENSQIQESFFNEMHEKIEKDIHNLDKLENWYNGKLMPQDTIEEMKDYWSNQKSAVILHLLGTGFKDNIKEKINNLQELEKDWQTIYFELIEKEEQIKREEKELKKTLGDFLEIYKRRLGNSKKVKKAPNKKKKK